MDEDLETWPLMDDEDIVMENNLPYVDKTTNAMLQSVNPENEQRGMIPIEN